MRGGGRAPHPGQVEHGRWSWAQGAQEEELGHGHLCSPKEGLDRGRGAAGRCVWKESEQVLGLTRKENRNTQESSPQAGAERHLLCVFQGGVCPGGAILRAVSQAAFQHLGSSRMPDAFPRQESGPRAPVRSLSKVTLLYTAVCIFYVHLDREQLSP